MLCPSMSRFPSRLFHVRSAAANRLFRPASRSAFTLVEVVTASTVLVLAIVSAISTLRLGYRSMDAARNLPRASQILQTELENLRLYDWEQLQSLQDSHVTDVKLDPVTTGLIPDLAVTREITDVRADMKQIAVTATWTGLDGLPQHARLITRYGKNGLNDYFYTAH